MAKITIYTSAHCPYCEQAKQLLVQQALPYTEIRVDTDLTKRAEMVTLTGKRSVPQIIINDQSIGGFDDLAAAITTGQLANLLKH